MRQRKMNREKVSLDLKAKEKKWMINGATSGRH